MKINRIALSIMILGLSSALIFSCKKPNNEAPVADTETQTAIDATWATFAITDVEQITAFIGENQLLTNFYREVPGSYNSSNGTGTMTATRDTVGASKNINFAFNKTWSYDGRFREGTVFWTYSYDPDYNKYVKKANPNARYTHDFGMVARISLSDYKVDGWQIDVDPTKRGIIRTVVANITPENYVTTKDTIKWTISGDFIFKHPTDATKNMNISVELTKALVNSSEKKIYDQSILGSYIKWSNFNPGSVTSAVSPSIATVAAKVAYTGVVCGNTSNGEKFRMVIDTKHPLIRDFTCYADKIGGVAVGSGTVGLVPRYQEFHPFIEGIASFTTGLDATSISSGGKSAIYPRQIYFGNEDQIKDGDDKVIPAQCDNAAMVLIKGIGYQVELKK